MCESNGWEAASAVAVVAATAAMAAAAQRCMPVCRAVHAPEPCRCPMFPRTATVQDAPRPHAFDASHRAKEKTPKPIVYLSTYGTVLEVASLRPTLGAYLPTRLALHPRLRIGLRPRPRLLAFVLTRRLRVGRRLRRAADPHRGAAALRRRLRIGRRLRGRATVARRRVAMLLADLRSHR